MRWTKEKGVLGATVTLRVAADVVLGGLQVIPVSSLAVRNPFTAWSLFIVLRAKKQTRRPISSHSQLTLTLEHKGRI